MGFPNIELFYVALLVLLLVGGCATTSPSVSNTEVSSDGSGLLDTRDQAETKPANEDTQQPESSPPEGYTTLSPGTFYKGSLSSGSLPEGQGDLILPDGTRYIGSFREGYYDGEGVEIAPDGRKWAGTWVGGNMEGYGTFENGDDKYVGQWRNGRLHGQGKFTYDDGGYYTGEWKDGMQDGEGTRVFMSGSTLEGIWVNNECTQCKFTYAHGATYVGGLKNLKHEGTGTLTLKSGLRIQGEWKDGEIYSGTMVFTNGDKYQGQITRHEPDPNPKEVVYYLENGQGTMLYANGNSYSGEWRLGQRHGFGKMVSKDGKVYEGMWREDEYFGTRINENPPSDTFPNITVPSGTLTPPAPVRATPVLGSGAIESQIDGEFEGWDGETIVKLMNGQIWQQTEFYYHYHYSFMPDVIIYASGAGYKMKVEGVDRAVGVTRVR